MTKTTSAYVIACLLVLPLAACGNKSADTAAPATLQTEDQKTLYALGLLIGRNTGIKVFNLTPEELAIVQKGIGDFVTGAKQQVELDTYGPKVNALAQARQAAGAVATKTKGKEFLDAAGKETGATVLPSGVVIKTIKPGTGASPASTDTVKVHYAGTLTDGTEFDSSIKRGEPAEFAVTGVVPCWTQALQKMKVGEKAKVVCPSDQAYGDQGSPPSIPGGSTLVFEVELLDIKK
jgi:FKBP-type peptidyl-prolyl cis-trans isomerase FkpA